MAHGTRKTRHVYEYDTAEFLWAAAPLLLVKTDGGEGSWCGERRACHGAADAGVRWRGRGCICRKHHTTMTPLPEGRLHYPARAACSAILPLLIHQLLGPPLGPSLLVGHGLGKGCCDRSARRFIRSCTLDAIAS